LVRVREFGNPGARSQWFRAVNWIDVILACVLALFGLRGFFRGFFRELFSLLGLIVGVILAIEFAQPAANYAAQWWNLPPLLLKGATFVAIFFVAYFALNMIGWLLHGAESLSFVRSLNRAGGVLIGLGKGAAILALLVFFLAGVPALSKAQQESSHRSYLLPPLARFAEGIIRIGKQQVLTRLNWGGPSATERL
jgi:membrane protein required for colicin V production